MRDRASFRWTSLGAGLGLAAMAAGALGCATNTGTVLDDKRAQGAILGGIAGAATGAAVDDHKRGRGAAIGTVVGALTGAAVGHYLENKERAAQELDAIPDANVETQGDSVIVSFAGEVMFDSGSRNLSPGALSRLDSVATTINRYPDADVIVKGHTDAQGSEATNLRLSEDRAAMVKNQLIAKGVAPQRVTAIGFGESVPLATNSTPEGRAMNRRVEIELRPARGAREAG